MSVSKEDGTQVRLRALVLLTLALVAFHACAIAQPPQLPDGKIPLIDRPWSADSDKFSFAILGDKTSGGEGKWPIYDRAVDAINLLAPDFVITVGDQIPGHMQDRPAWDAEWAEYMNHANRIETPLFLIPGNHDIANVECYRFWKEDFGRTYYAFDYKRCHFLMLNTEEERFDGRGPVWQTMMRFAEDDLAAHAGSRHTFLFFHKPMWDDPRYDKDWARIEQALGERPFTVVAGHEHYLATERKGNGLYVIQNATGGGIQLSGIREFGCFQAFANVTVDGADVRYAIIEPEGRVWPVDVSPAWFRKAIAFRTVYLDAWMPEGLGTPTATVHATLTFHNALRATATVRAEIGPLDASGWEPVPGPASDWKVNTGSAVLERTLAPGKSQTESLTFRVPAARVSYPPGVGYDVQYHGEWLTKESYPMVEVNAIPLYPASTAKLVPRWQLVGPFPLGPIDTSFLPAEPAKANANFFKRFGPEDGYDPNLVYEGGRRWFPCEPQANGLLNFNALMGTLDHAVGYALFRVNSPVDQLTHATLYADNFSQVVLNGKLVEEGQDFGAPGGFVYVPLRLKAGSNTVIAKLINNRGDWFLRFLLADPMGNLRFE